MVFFFFLISAKHCFRPFTVFKAFFSPSSTMLRPGFRSPQENTSCNSLSVTSKSSESESETQSGAGEGVCPSHCMQVHIHRRKSSSPRPPHLEKGAPGHTPAEINLIREGVVSTENEKNKPRSTHTFQKFRTRTIKRMT